ncbi:exocyst complex component 7-like protein [Corchorus olitorius]|uniref:Exocyst complex component 7-like protein n=1 Tax=Corchorus olitorius TaxID=93759 RepID=A0A1R3HWP0_9ROSI|nr:exocyst complex component 7-like protein [Corchorus olitorius]
MENWQALKHITLKGKHSTKVRQYSTISWNKILGTLKLDNNSLASNGAAKFMKLLGFQWAAKSTKEKRIQKPINRETREIDRTDLVNSLSVPCLLGSDLRLGESHSSFGLPICEAEIGWSQSQMPYRFSLAHVLSV